MLHPYKLGASLYMPAIRQDIWQVISRQKLKNIDSIIICLEDSVHEKEVFFALENLSLLLHVWQKETESKVTGLPNRPLVFIRPRNTDMLHRLSGFININLVDGFVLPKVDLYSLEHWQLACKNLAADKLLMVTLETASIFDTAHNMQLSAVLSSAFDQSVFAIRIGGNDLLSCLRMRRPNSMTIYDTPISSVIYQLLGCFGSQGYYLTAPVFEYLDEALLFEQEVAKDVLFGFVGKTIIHPSQIDKVQQAFRVSKRELAQAKAILDSGAEAVFKQDDAMLEPATHSTWAANILIRKEIFG